MYMVRFIIISILIVSCSLEPNEKELIEASDANFSEITEISKISDYRLRPKGIAVDDEGNIYVAFFFGHVIGKFSKNGTTIGWLGLSKNSNEPVNTWSSDVYATKSIKPGAFAHPHTIKIYNNELYVSEYENNRIQKFSLNGAYLGVLGVKADGQFTDGIVSNISTIKTGTTNGLFKGLANIGFGGDGSLYATDYTTGSVIKFNPQLQYVGWIGKIKNSITTTGWKADGSPEPSNIVGGFKGVHGVTAYNNKLYISDTHNHRILRYNLNGEFEAWLGKGSQNKWSSDKNVISQVSRHLGGFNAPIDTFFLSDGTLVVLEVYGFRIQTFKPDGSPKNTFTNGFKDPYHFTLKGDQFLIADTTNERILVFNIDEL